MQHHKPEGRSWHNYLERLHLLASSCSWCFCLQLYCCYGALSLWTFPHHTLLCIISYSTTNICVPYFMLPNSLATFLIRGASSSTFYLLIYFVINFYFTLLLLLLFSFKLYILGNVSVTWWNLSVKKESFFNWKQKLLHFDSKFVFNRITY